MSKPNLPPLPTELESVYVSVDGLSTYREARDCYYTMDHMYAYAEEAVRQALAAQLPVADERAAFEAFQRGAGLDELYFERHPESGQYMWTATKEAWETWQARAALSFKPETRDG